MGVRTLKTLKYAPNFFWFWWIVSFPVGFGFWLRFILIKKTSRVEWLGAGLNFKGPAIYVNWHKCLPYLIPHHGEMGRSILASKAPYMEPIIRWCILCGLRLVRGASGENGKEALGLLAAEIQAKRSVVIAVDGPAGPIFKSKRGCVELARITGAPIIPVGYRCIKGKPNWKRWDHSWIPGFFDKIQLEYGKPIQLNSKNPLSDVDILAEVDSVLNVLSGENATQLK